MASFTELYGQMNKKYGTPVQQRNSGILETGVLQSTARPSRSSIRSRSRLYKSDGGNNQSSTRSMDRFTKLYTEMERKYSTKNPIGNGLRAVPQGEGKANGLDIGGIRDNIQQELGTVTSELNALEKEYPSAVYSALSTPADLDVDVPMLGPAATGSTLQKEVADYSTRKSALQKRQRALNEEIAAIDTAQQLWVETQKLSELTGGYDPGKDREAGQAGWDAYQAYVTEKSEAAQTAKEEETLWEKMGRWYSGSHVDTSLPLHVDANQLAQGAQQQESKKRMPQEDWTEEQKLAYGYLWQNARSKAADYAYSVNSSRMLKKELEQLQAIQEDTTSSPGGAAMHTVGAILAAPFGLADYLGDIISQSSLGYIPETEGQVTPFEYSQAVTGSVSQDLNDKYGTLNEAIPVIGGKGWGDVYGLGTGIAQSALAAYAGGPGQALVQFFGSSAASGIDDALSRGATGEQAILYGTMLGAADGVAEMIGVDNLFKLGSVSTFRQLFWNLIKQGTAEGIEEGITSVLNNFADDLVMRDKSNFYVLTAQYMTEDGMSEKNAKRRAWWKIAEDTAYETLAGSISGMTHAAGHATAVDTGFRNYYDSIIKMEGDLYGEGQAADIFATERRMEGISAESGGTQREASDRPGIQEELGEEKSEVRKDRTFERFGGELSQKQSDFDTADYFEPEMGSPLQRNRDVFSKEYGIECTIIKASAWKQKNPAYARNGKVYISSDIDTVTLRTAVPHEATHVMLQQGFSQYQKFVDSTADFLQMPSDATSDLLCLIAEHCGIDVFDMSAAEQKMLYSELNATVYGMYQGGIFADARYDYGQWIPGAFKDFDGYIRQMDEIHAQFKQQFGSASGAADSKTDDISEIMSPKGDVGADNSIPLSDRDVLLQVLESTDLQTVDPRLRPVLRDYGRHLQQLKTIGSLQQKQQVKITQLQKTGSSANALQTAQRDLTKLEQMHAQQLQRLKKLEQKTSLQNIIRDTKMVIETKESSDQDQQELQKSGLFGEVEFQDLFQVFEQNSAYRTTTGEFDIDHAKSDYDAFLITAPEKHRMYLQQSFNSVQYALRDSQGVAFGYSASQDTVYYNPSNPDFWRMDFAIANTHELAHRIDYFFISARDSVAFREAIQNAKKVIDADPAKFIAYSIKNDTDGFLSDIFSAIADGEYKFYSGHDAEYWREVGNKEHEIFANIFSLEAYQDQKKLDFIKEHFREIFEAYKEFEY